MTNNIQLRDVIESDLPIFYQQQLDPEATQMAAFPCRSEEAFMTHWRDKVLAIAAWTGAERQAFACKSMEQSQAHYSWQRVAKETLAVYRGAFSPGITHEKDCGQA